MTAFPLKRESSHSRVDFSIVVLQQASLYILWLSMWTPVDERSVQSQDSGCSELPPNMHDNILVEMHAPSLAAYALAQAASFELA